MAVVYRLVSLCGGDEPGAIEWSLQGEEEPVRRKRGFVLGGTIMLGVVVLLLVALATASARPEVVTSIYGGNFRYPVIEPTGLDPVDDGADWALLDQIFEGLVKYDENQKPVSAIAESWTSPDAITWTFSIRTGARFHNGRQITANDVYLSWLRAQTTSGWWYVMDNMAGVSSYLALDASTFQVVLNGPYAPFPYIVGLPPFSVIPPEELGTIDTSPVGSGPFVFQSWNPGSEIVLGANTDYYVGRPYLDNITFSFYGSDDEMYTGFQAGNLDISPVPRAYQDGLIGDPNVITVPYGIYYFGMKVDWAPFNDVRVRQAINYAVDKQDIIDNVVEGYQLVADGFTPPGMQGYDPVVEGYDYDPTQALTLLAAAGWTDTNSDGILDDGLGTDLTIEMWHNTGAGHAAIAAAEADDLRDIGGTGLGATVTISDTDWTTYQANLDNYPMYRLGWTGDYPEPFDFLDPIFRSTSDANHSHYSNSSVDSWLNDAKGTLDGASRRTLYATIESQVQDDAPFLNLYYYNSVYLKQPLVQGLTMPMEIPQMENVWFELPYKVYLPLTLKNY